MQQAIQLHVDLYDETHRDLIRVFFPEMPTELLTESDLRRLSVFRNEPDESIERWGPEGTAVTLSREILAIYNKHHS